MELVTVVVLVIAEHRHPGKACKQSLERVQVAVAARAVILCDVVRVVAEMDDAVNPAGLRVPFEVAHVVVVVHAHVAENGELRGQSILRTSVQRSEAVRAAPRTATRLDTVVVPGARLQGHQLDKVHEILSSGRRSVLVRNSICLRTVLERLRAAPLRHRIGTAVLAERDKGRDGDLGSRMLQIELFGVRSGWRGAVAPCGIVRVAAIAPVRRARVMARHRALAVCVRRCLPSQPLGIYRRLRALVAIGRKI